MEYYQPLSSKKIDLFVRVLVIVVLLGSVTDAVAGGKRKFGGFGSTGERGYEGQAGASGQSLVIDASGPQKSFILSGGSGSHGEYGQDGGDAYDCEQPHKPDRNLRAASGGDGGDGGAGGDGGSGGDVTILYNKLSDVKRINVVSAGGAGGEGGSGGRGGQACDCYRQSWSVRVCEDKKNKDGSTQNVCKNNQHSCQDGKHGDRGSRGARGRHGADGTLYLVKGPDRWQPDLLHQTTSLDLAANESFTLNQNIFVRKTGAAAMLAPGSVVNGDYMEYESTEYAKFSLKWESPRPPSDFSATKFILNKQGKEVVHEIESVLVDYVQTGTEDKVVTIKNIVKSGEARAVEFSIEPDGPNTVLTVVDNSSTDDLLNNSFTLQYFTKTLFGWKRRLDRELTDEEWEQTANGFVVKLVNLGIKKKFIKKRRKVKVNFSMTRSLGEDTVNVEHTEKLKL